MAINITDIITKELLQSTSIVFEKDLTNLEKEDLKELIKIIMESTDGSTESLKVIVKNNIDKIKIIMSTPIKSQKEENITKLCNKLWSICSLLYSSNVPQVEYFTQMIPLLALKVAEEKGLNSLIPHGYNFNELLKIDNSGAKGRAFRALINEGQEGNDLWSTVENQMFRSVFQHPTKIKDKQLQEIVAKLNEERWAESIGDCYEFLLKKTYAESSGSHGQHFTPRDVVDLTMKIAKKLDIIKDGITVTDPAMGTGGYLIEALLTNSNINVQGVEIIKETYRASMFNLLAHGINTETANLMNNSTMDGFAFRRLVNTSDLILANPPFRTVNKAEIGYCDDVWKSSKLQFNFLRAMWQMLKPNGYMITIVPTDIFFDNNATNSAIRKEYLDNNKILGIINLGKGLFDRTAVKTAILISKRGEPTDVYKLYDLSKNTYNLTSRLNPNDIENILSLTDGWIECTVDNNNFKFEDICDNADNDDNVSYDEMLNDIEVKMKEVIQIISDLKQA